MTDWRAQEGCDTEGTTEEHGFRASESVSGGQKSYFKATSLASGMC